MCRDWSSRRWQIDAKKVGEAHHIVIAGDPEPDRNSFIRTDQYSFVQAGVPALAMKFGWDGRIAGVQGVARMAGGAVSLDGG